MLNIVLLLGTIRVGRESEKVFRVIKSLLEKQDVALTIFDLKELNLPPFDDAQYDHPGVKKMLEAFKEMDGCVIVTPEYNHGMPGALKSAIDYAGENELKEKPLAVVGVSDGQFGGVRCIKQVEAVWIGNRGIVLPVFLPTQLVKEFDEANPPAPWLAKADTFVANAVRLFTILKLGKEAYEKKKTLS